MLQVPQAFRNLLKDAENWHLASCADLKMDITLEHRYSLSQDSFILNNAAESPASEQTMSLNLRRNQDARGRNETVGTR